MIYNRNELRNSIVKSLVLICILSVCCLVGGMKASASSASVSIRCSNSHVVKGDVIYVIVTVKSTDTMSGFQGYFSYDNKVLKFVTGGSVVSGNDDEFYISDTDRSTGVNRIRYSVKFIARKAGSTSIELKQPYAVYNYDDSTKMSVSFNSLNILVNKKSSGKPSTSKSTAKPSQSQAPASQSDSGGQSGNDGQMAQGASMPQGSGMPQGSAMPQGSGMPQSSGMPQGSAVPAANKPGSSLLSDLSVDGVTLSPEFDSSIFKYSGVVTTDDSTLNISYTAEDMDATVTVKGNKKLKAGKNVIRVEVKGTQGKKSTYKLTVRITRNNDETAGESSEDTQVTATYEDGVTTLHYSSDYQVTELENADTVPEEFGETEVEISGHVVKAYALESDTNHTYVLIYCKHGDDDAEFYLYDTKEDTLMPYAKVQAWYRSVDGNVVVQGDTSTDSKIKSLKYLIGVMVIFCLLMVIAVISIYLHFKGNNNIMEYTDSDDKSDMLEAAAVEQKTNELDKSLEENEILESEHHYWER